ncbi:general transcription factor 3C polypeptide 5-like [Salvia divinorum]|uniref:General transcription factor 3C polypeptide 5-like n=1 Tax=Salvia divinorum TaxID=28513 RepID=A0ABD1HCE4_SALDI
MGLVEDGSISGVLPSGREAFVVHYPGYPSSADRAIETLGGMQQILKVRAEKPNKLELYFRPEDPYSHPASGELQPCTKFLLKFSKKKLKVTKNVENHSGHTSADPLRLNEDVLISQSTETTENTAQPNCESMMASSEAKTQINNGPQEQLCADVVARVSEEYHFNGMVDYQHVLAVHANATRRKKRNLVDMEAESGDPVNVDQDDLMILVPPLFSLKGQPQKMILKPSGDLNLPKKQDTVVRKQSELEIDQCLAIDFNIKDILIYSCICGYIHNYLTLDFPKIKKCSLLHFTKESFMQEYVKADRKTWALVPLQWLKIPKKVDWEKSIARESDLWKWQTIVCELFEERPVWVKHSLADNLLDRGVNVSERVLKRLLFLTAYYFSNGPFMRFWIRKGYDPRKDPESRIYQRTDFRVPPPIRNYCDTNLMSGLKCRWKDICEFRVFPRKAQILLQLFELDDDYIQQEIRKPASHEICTLQTGWFTSQILDILRLRVALRFLSVYPETGAQSLLRSVTNRFERLKILHLTMKDKKAKQADKEVVEAEDMETNDEVEVEVEVEVEDEDDEEDEMEDENLGEDVDIDEVLDMADPDRDFFLPDTYIENDNISKDYLQDLFGSFPFGSAGGNEMQDDPYDEEYQIYDQGSDGNFSNDED